MQHEHYMMRCLNLAILGLGKVSPNPMVGCVIVVDNHIIGEGWHQKYGQAHAEVNALNAVLEKYGDEAAALLKDATVYVSLEPCVHYGKTPPCAELLIKHRVKHVVIGSVDPFPAVNGKGVEQLQQAGIIVTSGILKAQCDEINKRFFTRITKQRPYVILKWAQTADGYFAPLLGQQQWITGPEAKVINHKWRTEEDAILVGKNTVLIDNPHLTARDWEGKNPLRIVIDKNLEVPQHYNVFNGEATTLILNARKTDTLGNIKWISVEDMQHYLVQKILYQLHIMDIQSIIIEGGAQILNQFIEANLWDEARIFIGPDHWKNGLPAPKLQKAIVEHAIIGPDTLNIVLNK